METLDAQQNLAETRQSLDRLEAEIRQRCPRAFPKPREAKTVFVRPLALGEVDFVDAEKLARAVVRRALDDLLPATPIACFTTNELIQARATAKKFLLHGLWARGCVWGIFVKESKETIIAEAKRRIAELEEPKAVAS